MKLLDPRNGPAFDLPACAEPPRTLLIASTPRTGSTLLGRLLASSERVGVPSEYLNPMQWRDWDLRFGGPFDRWRASWTAGPWLATYARFRSPTSLGEHLARVRSRRTSATGWFGLKLHHHHAIRWFGADLRHLDRWLPGLSVVRIRRRDRRAQAASWVRATRTGRFAAHQRGYGPDVVDRWSVDRAERWLADADAGWDRGLGGRAVVDVDYEDLVAAPLDVAGWVLRRLGEGDARIAMPPTGTQSDPGWRARVDALR